MSSESVLSLYDGMPWRTRMHVRGRWRLFPFEALMAYVPKQGHFVDLGCGHGLWVFLMAAHAPNADILGVDPDAEKIEMAALLAKKRKGRIRFETALAQSVDLQAPDLVSMIDVMYLIPFEMQEQILTHVAKNMLPGGRLLLKVMRKRPAWKFAWNVFEETVAVKIIGLTYGAKFYFRAEDEWRALLEKLGFRVQAVPMDKGYLHPHLLLVGEKK